MTLSMTASACPKPPSLVGLGRDLRCAVIGASGGIGGAVQAHLEALPEVARVHAFSRSGEGDGHLDLTDEASIEAAAARAAADGPLDLVFVAAGLLHTRDGLAPEKTWRALEMENMERVFAVNTFGPVLAAKHFIPKLAKNKRAVFAAISARVGSISDNALGGWYAYRASKAALNQMIKCLAIEATRTRPETVICGLHPGTVDTGLSAPFQGNVAPEKLFTPERSAAHMLNVINGLAPEHSGRVFAWDGEEVLP